MTNYSWELDLDTSIWLTGIFKAEASFRIILHKSSCAGYCIGLVIDKKMIHSNTKDIGFMLPLSIYE